MSEKIAPVWRRLLLLTVPILGMAYLAYVIYSGPYNLLIRIGFPLFFLFLIVEALYLLGFPKTINFLEKHIPLGFRSLLTLAYILMGLGYVLLDKFYQRAAGVLLIICGIYVLSHNVYNTYLKRRKVGTSPTPANPD